jgi:RNA polymerase sigma-70 factor (ECF subfamily)
MDVLVIRAPEIDDSWAGSREALSACLKQITARSRELIDLRYGEQLSPAQVAERISWTVEAVKVGLSRVRKMLRECVQRRFSVEGL